MKLPEQLSGVQRGRRQARMERTALPAKETGIVPQDEWCENQCWDAYEEGSPEQEECLQSCWAD